MKRMARWISVPLLLYVAFQLGCWNTVATSRSPDRRHTVTIKQLCLGSDCTIKAKLSPSWLPVDVVLGADAIFGSAYIFWAPDSSKVGVLVSNRIGAPLLTGFETHTRTAIPFDNVRDMVAAGIQRKYGLTVTQLAPYKGDVVAWASQDHTAATLSGETASGRAP